MKGNIEFSSGFCGHCQELRKLERASALYGCGDLFMVLLTLGLWMIFRALAKPAWRCTVCGSAASSS